VGIKRLRKANGGGARLAYIAYVRDATLVSGANAAR